LGPLLGPASCKLKEETKAQGQAPSPKPQAPKLKKNLRKTHKNGNPTLEKSNKNHKKKIQKKSKTQKCKTKNKSKQIISKSIYKSKVKANSMKMQRKSSKFKKIKF
jgi:hypothetical protein